VAELLTKWVAHQRKRREGNQIAAATMENYGHLCRYWTDAIGDVQTKAFTRELVEDTITNWLAEGVAPRTCKTALDILVAAVNWGRTRNHCPAVPLSRLSVLQIRDDEFVAVSYTPTRQQVAAVLQHLDGWYRDLLTLQALTGARIGEIAALHVGDWDRVEGTLTISGRDDRRERRGKVKPRRWPVMGELGRLLETLAGERAADERLVQIPARLFAAQLSRHLKPACKAAGVPEFTSHGIRRLVALELLDGGVDAKTVSELTGHSVVVLLRRYVRPTSERLRDVVARAGLTAVAPRGQVVQLRAGKAEEDG
jgi:integrase